MSVALGLVNWRAVGMAIVRGRDVRQVEPPRATAAESIESNETLSKESNSWKTTMSNEVRAANDLAMIR